MFDLGRESGHIGQKMLVILMNEYVVLEKKHTEWST